MENNKIDIEAYKPISCDYVDYIEHLATLKQLVTIEYMENQKLCLVKNDLILTWKNEDSVEYLYSKNGLKIRLDYIVSINNKKPDEDCSL